ncbi:transmembrane protein 154 [Betta splendens]|uniref:Transmembrane protein 154 n=1 Tax=Betta splendens TaxID=158456 RepID=A0A6P7NJA2_BETSP|nr:transmembrane protein 154 [Betta splendens]
MSASLPADMRGPRAKTPLLLLLLLLAALTGTVLCQDEEQAPEEPEDSNVSPTEVELEASSPTPAPEASNTLATGDEITSDYGSGLHQSSTENPLISDPEFDHGAETTEDPATTAETEGDGLFLLIILIPAVLVVAIIGTIVCGIFICRRRNRSSKTEELRQEDPYLDGSSTDKVPMPMFEEDVPSVLELEMEELDQWMKKDSETAESS